MLFHWNLSFGTTLFKGHLHSGDTKNVHRSFVCVTSIEGTPQSRGKGHFFLDRKPGNLQSEDSLQLKT